MNPGTEARRIGAAGRSSYRSLAAASAGLLVTCAASGAASGTLGWAALPIAGGGLGLLGAWLIGRKAPAATLVALFISSALVSSVVPPNRWDYGAVVCAAFTLTASAFLLVLEGRAVLAGPTRAVALLTGCYLVFGLVASAAGITPVRSTALICAVGVLMLASAVAVPTMFGTNAKLYVAAGVAATATLLAAIGLLLAVTGPIRLANGWAGRFELLELTVSNRGTSIIIPRLAGIFARPGFYSIDLALGLASLLALQPLVIGRRRRLLLQAGIVITALGVLFTLSRTGWLAATAGSCLVGIAHLRNRQAGRTAVVVGLTFTILTGALLVGAIGANGRYDLAVKRYGLEATEQLIRAGNGQVKLAVGKGGSIKQSGVSVERGGAESSSRRVLWNASADAIRARPVLGYGTGTNAAAIAPYLTGDYVGYRGLGSHNALLSEWIEGGLFFALALVAILLVSFVSGMRNRARRVSSDPADLALAAIQVAAVPALLFESLYLGGFALQSTAWTLAVIGSNARALPLLTDRLINVRRRPNDHVG